MEIHGMDVSSINKKNDKRTKQTMTKSFVLVVVLKLEPFWMAPQSAVLKFSWNSQEIKGKCPYPLRIRTAIRQHSQKFLFLNFFGLEVVTTEISKEIKSPSKNSKNLEIVILFNFSNEKLN